MLKRGKKAYFVELTFADSMSRKDILYWIKRQKTTQTFFSLRFLSLRYYKVEYFLLVKWEDFIIKWAATTSLWLEIGHTNKQSKVFAHFFLEIITQLGWDPTRVRADDGTEKKSLNRYKLLLEKCSWWWIFQRCQFMRTLPANQKI